MWIMEVLPRWMRSVVMVLFVLLICCCVCYDDEVCWCVACLQLLGKRLIFWRARVLPT